MVQDGASILFQQFMIISISSVHFGNLQAGVRHFTLCPTFCFTLFGSNRTNDKDARATKEENKQRSTQTALPFVM